MQTSKCALLLALIAPVFGSDSTPTQPNAVRVHEWGTFTSVAGEDGGPQAWTPLAGPSDLPCFVYHLGSMCIKCAPTAAPFTSLPTLTSMVRMETPVLYFYASQPTTVSVGVDFPKGWITEWYPSATSVLPEIYHGQNLPPLGNGHIQWDNIQILPGSSTVGPQGKGASRYYAARNTDSDPIHVSNQAEKLIFYRGIANFPVPIWAKVLDDTTLEIRNKSDATLPMVLLFENQGGKMGFRVIREFSGAVQVEAPELTADKDQLRKDLSNALVDLGLFPKEAQAMLDTWHDSWFEDGMRVLYLMPRRSVDAVLPLHIVPQPAGMARAFVGRVEILSPYVRQALSSALSSGDTATLAKYGRFLEPFAARIPGGSTANRATAAFFKARYNEAARETDKPSCVQ
jgi:hypothetical protein